jgi:mRNA interferase RelE/StbE
MSYQLVLTKRALKQIDNIVPKQRRMLLAWMAEHLDGCENPKTVPGGKQIQGTQNGWRYRVGSYRILARIEEKELLVEVVRIGHRQGVYGNIPDM